MIFRRNLYLSDYLAIKIKINKAQALPSAIFNNKVAA
jgi:hypothetical protein